VKTAVAKKKAVIPMKSLKMQQSDDEDDIFEQKIDKKSCSSLKTSKPRQQRNKKVEKVLKEKEWSEEEEFEKDIADSDEDASFAPLLGEEPCAEQRKSNIKKTVIPMKILILTKTKLHQ
jgi:hypothetical protein